MHLIFERVLNCNSYRTIWQLSRTKQESAQGQARRPAGHGTVSVQTERLHGDQILTAVPRAWE